MQHTITHREGGYFTRLPRELLHELSYFEDNCVDVIEVGHEYSPQSISELPQRRFVMDLVITPANGKRKISISIDTAELKTQFRSYNTRVADLVHSIRQRRPVNLIIDDDQAIGYYLEHPDELVLNINLSHGETQVSLPLCRQVIKALFIVDDVAYDHPNRYVPFGPVL